MFTKNVVVNKTVITRRSKKRCYQIIVEIQFFVMPSLVHCCRYSIRGFTEANEQERRISMDDVSKMLIINSIYKK